MNPDDLTTGLTPSATAEDALGGPCLLNVFAGSCGDRPVVTFETTEPDEDGEPSVATFLTLTASGARAFAAGILNAADAADKTTPLVFQPACKAPCCEATPKVADR